MAMTLALAVWTPCPYPVILFDGEGHHGHAIVQLPSLVGGGDGNAIANPTIPTPPPPCPFKEIQETDPLNASNYSYKVIATKELAPGDLILTLNENDLISFATYHVKGAVKCPDTISSIGSNNNEIEEEELESLGSALGLDSCFKKYDLINVRTNVVPDSWICFGCYDSVGSIYPCWCQACGLPLCGQHCHPRGSEECQAFTALGKNTRRFLDLTWLFFDVAVAKVLMKIKNDPEFTCRIAKMFAYHRILDYGNSSQFDEWDQLENPRQMKYSYNLVRRMAYLDLPIQIDTAKQQSDLITFIFVLVTAAGVSFYEHENITFFHPLLTSFTHSCCSNTEVVVEVAEDGLAQIFVYASTVIQKNEPITVDYLHEMYLPTIDRRKLLHARYNINCRCIRCKDPTEFGTFLGSSCCDQCENGYLIKTGVPCLEELVFQGSSSSILVCSNRELGCNGTKLSQQVDSEMRCFYNILIEMEEDATDLMDMYEKFKFVKMFLDKRYLSFHGSHMLSLYVRNKLFQLMRSFEFYDPINSTGYERLTDDAISAQKFITDFMNEFCQIAGVFAPKSSREFGIAKYYKAIAEKAKVDFILARQAMLTTPIGFLNVAIDRYFPDLIASWECLKLYKVPLDFYIFHQIACCLIQLNPTEFHRRVQAVFNPDYIITFEDIEPLLNDMIVDAKLGVSRLAYYKHRTLFGFMGLLGEAEE